MSVRILDHLGECLISPRVKMDVDIVNKRFGYLEFQQRLRDWENLSVPLCIMISVPVVGRRFIIHYDVFKCGEFALLVEHKSLVGHYEHELTARLQPRIDPAKSE